MPAFRQHAETPAAATRVPSPLDERLDLDLFKALGDRNRLLVLSCLVKCGRPCSVSEVAECCGVDFSVVNKHLKRLAEAGVLEAEKRGRTVWYAARCGDLCRRLSELVDAIAEWCPNLPATEERPRGTSCCGSDEPGTDR